MKAISKKVRHAATVLAISSLTFSFSGVVIANEPALGQKGDTHVDPNSYLVPSTDGGKNFYCAVDKDNNRGIAVATSKDLGKSTLEFSK